MIISTGIHLEHSTSKLRVLSETAIRIENRSLRVV